MYGSPSGGSGTSVEAIPAIGSMSPATSSKRASPAVAVAAALAVTTISDPARKRSQNRRSVGSGSHLPEGAYASRIEAAMASISFSPMLWVSVLLSQ